MEPSDPFFPTWTVILAVGGFLILFPTIWCSVVWLISRISGWYRLSQYFRSENLFPSGESHRRLSGLIGGARYKGVLTLHTNDDGFYLEVMPLYRIGHPRLFIPWSAVTSRSPQKMMWLTGEQLTIGAPKIATMTLPAHAIQKREEASHQ